MRRSLFALLRGSDGRSLARALACLLLLNTIVAGLVEGAMAAPAAPGLLCSVDGAREVPASPDGANRSLTCCEMGCTAAAPALPPEPAAVPGPAIVPTGFYRHPSIAAAPPSALPDAHRPRGPPVLA